jgi:hypothetical protein
MNNEHITKDKRIVDCRVCGNCKSERETWRALWNYVSDGRLSKMGLNQKGSVM